MKTKILIIEDDAFLARLLRDRCESTGEYDCLIAQDGQAGITIAGEQSIDIALLDFELPDMTGLEVIKSLKLHDPLIQIVILTAYGTIERAVEAIKLGAADFLPKPVEFDRLKIIIGNLVEKQNMSKKLSLFSRMNDHEDFCGAESPAMKKTLADAARAAETEATVLIQGESGTGKEIVAKYIHTLSSRKSLPFVKVDCTVLQDTLIQSDLFGHEKGAFTGASHLKRGRIELADKGTVFFDEIGDLQENMQGKLLRLIQDKMFERLGGVKPVTVDIRIVAATNRKLSEMVNSGEFREDLFYRLNVVIIDIPPLRKRKEDIPLLAEYFFTQISKEQKKQIGFIDEDIYAALSNYHWPGNVRELRNVIERLVVFADSGKITPSSLPEEIGSVFEKDIPPVKDLKIAIGEFKKGYIEQILKKNNGNIAKTAKELNVPRTYLYSLIDSLNIKRIP